MQEPLHIKAPEQEEKTAMKGVYVFTKAILETPEHFILNDKVTKARDHVLGLQSELDAVPKKGFMGYWKEKERVRLSREVEKGQVVFNVLLRELNTICRTEKTVYENIVPTVGRTMIANNLTDATPDNAIRVKYAEVGSGTNTPANGDTTLQTSIYRNAVASETNAANIAYVTAFYTATETSGTYREAGIFADGTASAGTGILVSRVAINITKTTSQTLTIDWILTIS